MAAHNKEAGSNGAITSISDGKTLALMTAISSLLVPRESPRFVLIHSPAPDHDERVVEESKALPYITLGRSRGETPLGPRRTPAGRK